MARFRLLECATFEWHKWAILKQLVVAMKTASLGEGCWCTGIDAGDKILDAAGLHRCPAVRIRDRITGRAAPPSVRVFVVVTEQIRGLS